MNEGEIIEITTTILDRVEHIERRLCEEIITKKDGKMVMESLEHIVVMINLVRDEQIHMNAWLKHHEREIVDLKAHNA